MMRKACLKVSLLCALWAICSPAAPVKVALTSPQSRTKAPGFRLSDKSGGARTLAAYRGKVVLLNFWATECGGCRLEIPWFVNLDHTFRNQQVAVVGISLDISYEDLKNADEAWSRVNPFVEAHQIKYSILMGDDQISKNYQIEALPVTYLIDRDGRIAARYTGLIDEKNVEANIRTLLAERQ